MQILWIWSQLPRILTLWLAETRNGASSSSEPRTRVRILGVSACIAVSVYQDELFFKVKKKLSDYLFFNFDSFGFSLFAFRFSTKALGKNIIFVCFSNSERKWLVSPENTPHTLSSVFYGDFIFTLVTIFPSYSSLHSRIHGLAVLKNN